MALIRWKNKALKQYTKLPNNIRSNVKQAVENLEFFPEIANVKKLKNHESDYRLRVGDYRVLFSLVENEPVILLIEKVAKRDDRTY